jgi:hypothetical protein
VPKALAAILAQHPIEDVVVEDPPLEEVIAEVFSQVDAGGPGANGAAHDTELTGKGFAS